MVRIGLQIRKSYSSSNPQMGRPENVVINLLDWQVGLLLTA
jgi:hypothetical protein